MTPTQVTIVTLFSTISVGLLTIFGPSTNKPPTIPAWARALIVLGLSTVSGITQAELDHNVLWDSTSMLPFVSGLVIGAVKIGIEVWDGATQTTRSVRYAMRKGGGFGSMVLGALLLASCAGTFNEAAMAGHAERAKKAGATPVSSAPAPSDYCVSLDNQQLVLHAVAAGTGFLAAGSGVPALVLSDDNRDVKRGLAVGTVIAGAATAVLVLWADGKSTSWVRDCSQPEGVVR